MVQLEGLGNGEKISRRFGGSLHNHLQSRIISRETSVKAGSKHLYFALISCFGLFFDPKDVGDMFIRNVLTFGEIHAGMSQDTGLLIPTAVRT
jgi:hypothetical protein